MQLIKEKGYCVVIHNNEVLATEYQRTREKDYKFRLGLKEWGSTLGYEGFADIYHFPVWAPPGQMHFFHVVDEGTQLEMGKLLSTIQLPKMPVFSPNIVRMQNVLDPLNEWYWGSLRNWAAIFAEFEHPYDFSELGIERVQMRCIQKKIDNGHIHFRGQA